MTNELKSELFSNIDIHRLLLDMTKDPNPLQIETDYGNLSILMPIDSAYNGYFPVDSTENDPIFSKSKDNPKLNKKNLEKTNKRINKYNDFIESQIEELKTGKKDKKFTGKQEFNKWSLCLILDIPTLPKAGSRERFKKGIIVNNKFIFKRALLISVDQFVLRFNKMVYDYISTLIPNNRELGSQHLFYKPIIEYENWFQKTGHFVQDTPSLLDEIKESEKSENPLVTTSGENQELANAQKIILMQREKIKQLNNPAEMKVKEMILNKTLESKVDRLRFKSSGRVNWSGLSKFLGCSDKKAKDLILKYASFLQRDDEMGYLK